MFETVVRQLLYYPTRIPRDAPLPPHASDAQEVWWRSGVGDEIHALYWPAPPGRPTVLFFHGNAQSVYEWALVREDFAPVSVGLLLMDYPGYGKCSGSPSEQALYAAADGAYERLTGELGVAPEQVVVFGKSLGGGVGSYLAAHRKVRGLILESTFLSIPAVARTLFPFVPADAFLKKERFDTASRITSIHVPVLIIHGTRDDLIPFEQANQLFALAREPKELYAVEGALHNDVSMRAGPAYGRTIRRWIDGVTSGLGEEASAGREEP